MTDETQAIDRDVLADLENSVGDDPEFLREIVETYLEDAPAQLAAIREGLAGGDAQRAHRGAHTLKSNSASVGAMGLAALCQEMEMFTQPATAEAVDLATPEMSLRADAIADELERVRVELEELVPPVAD
jgi:two-component system sensor histidine kinase/response regulator